METCQLSMQFSKTPPCFRHASIKDLAFAKTQKLKCLPSVAATKNGSQIEKFEPESPNRMFILGLGFVGQFFARKLKKEGWVISGTCTSDAKKKELEEWGFDIHVLHASQPELSTLRTMKDYTHLLVSIPPIPRIGDAMLQHRELLRRADYGGNLKWLCYLSSTGVYGNCAGQWVDENYPASPTSELAKLRLDAEMGWLDLAHDLGISAQVFRLGGIYGPGRSAIDTIIKQETLSESQNMRKSRQFTSRVHVKDISQALLASIYKPSFGKIYNIVDDDPAPRQEVFAYAQDLIEKKWPDHIIKNTHVIGELPEKGNLRGEKRVSNARMKKELGVQLLHPSYKSGLKSIIDQMENTVQ